MSRAIDYARRHHLISRRDAARYRGIYRRARRSRSRMGYGRNRTELSSVIATLERIAARNKLTSGRMPALFLQLRRNREFWAGGPHFPPTYVSAGPCRKAHRTGPAGARITFRRSQLVYEYYPGQGLEIQPLGSAGKANGLWKPCAAHRRSCHRRALRTLLDELVAIRSSRGGFPTWEYWFYFSGGKPPWTSGMADATAIQALARGSRYLHVKRYMRVARSALKVFDRLAPLGVRVRGLGHASARYLLYSFSGERVLNAFAQTLNGLYEFSVLGHDRHARRLFREGDRSMRHEIHHYDTGSWTRYDFDGPEASLEYHRITAGFFRHLCDLSRIHFYCHYARRFEGYLGTPPRIRYTGPRTLSAHKRVSLSFKLNKGSCVTATITNSKGHRVFRRQRRLRRGRRTFHWRPRSPGRFRLTLEALDSRLNFGSRRVTLTVK